jgi:magnesium transporter
MANLLRIRSKPVGLAPGSIVFTGEESSVPVRIRCISYGPESLIEREFDSIDDFFQQHHPDKINWINIDGLNDTDQIKQVGEHFNIHTLVLEDIVHPGQRPKVEDHGDYLYIVIRMLYYDETAHELLSEQLSLIVLPGLVLSFQERQGDVFNPLRERLRNSLGRIRKKGSDYLAYALLDIIIDRYFLVLEQMNEQVEAIETLILENPTTETISIIGSMRRELIVLRKAVWPARDLLNNLEKIESSLIKKDTQPFLRDVYDHTIQVIDIADSLRDMIGVLRDSYQSVLGNRMNEIMKVLTIIATIFIPLTFMAGIYGMNFANMPELAWPFGYPLLIGLMVIVAAAMVHFFRSKDWL